MEHDFGRTILQKQHSPWVPYLCQMMYNGGCEAWRITVPTLTDLIENE